MMTVKPLEPATPVTDSEIVKAILSALDPQAPHEK